MIGLASAMLLEQAALPGWHFSSAPTDGNEGKDAPSLVVRRSGQMKSGGTNLPVAVSPSELAPYQSSSTVRSFAGSQPDTAAFTFVTPDAPTIQRLAAEITGGAGSTREKAERLLGWVRSNIADDHCATNFNFPRYPVETVADGKGGSHDASFLYLSLCKAAGVEGILLNYSNRMSTAVNIPDPAGAAVAFRGKTFTFAEPSAALAGPGGTKVTLGVFPGWYEGRDAVAYGPNIDAVVTGVDASGTNWMFTIPAARIQAHRSIAGKRGHFQLDDTAQAAFVTPGDPIIKSIAETLTRGAATDREKANILLHFVRSNIKYDFAETAPGADYFRFPLETIADRAGDCEDKSILFSSLTKAAGIDSALVRLPGHMASAVALKSGDTAGIGYHVGEKFYSFVETTGNDTAAVPHRIQRDSETGLAIGNPGNFTTATARVIVIP